MGDIGQAVDLCHQELEIGLLGGGGDMKDKIPLVGDVEAAPDLIHGHGPLLKFVEQRGGLFFQLDVGDNECGRPIFWRSRMAAKVLI